MPKLIKNVNPNSDESQPHKITACIWKLPKDLRSMGKNA